ncbi:ribose-phosphate diphosphokinase [Desulfobulbus alkaliphilus]|uniref:ribose-phosphate diphosphokinase n=1 Tax=Desulfobulbus alkaliphilus TaxID=869814 RepID=UPI001963AFCF|nr:ribose-phosphate diphosphokinase [Desulfobulbus alkaliphilus]MBM9536938.1 ribose-phosphate diphosphokinase [Desulfobulbus alkaliphilus]
MPKRENIILISNRAATRMAAEVARELAIPVTEMITRTFADGELYHAFPRDIAGHDLVIIASTPDDLAHQELIDLVTGARYWNALSVNVIIPYLGYSTMERAKPESGEIPKGITRTRQIFRARPDYVAFIDLHSESVMHAHSGEIRTRHLWTEQVAAAKIRAMKLENIVLVSPDYGFSKRVARLAGLLDCPHTAANKDRYDVDRTIIGQLSGAVRDRTAIICDDMIRTGGSMLQTVDRCYEAGAVGVMIMATHLVLAGNARQRFVERGINCIIGADTYPGQESDDLLHLYSVAPVIADELKGYFRLQ